MNLVTVVFMGRSGCGKGTQVDKLVAYIKSKDQRGIVHLEAGGRFRSFIKEATYASSIANTINEKGGLQPEFLAIWAWGGDLVRRLKPNQHLLIDGTPRRLIEARVLESAFDFFDREKVHIVYINVSKEWAMEKMIARGRSDDKELSGIEQRMKWFQTDVAPILDYYRGHKKHLFHDINGEQSIDKVHQDIIRAMGI